MFSADKDVSKMKRTVTVIAALGLMAATLSPAFAAKSPGVKLGFSDTTPEPGATVSAKASLQNCQGHSGTKIQLQRKVGSSFQKVAEKKLNSKCTATFKVVADFTEATFRSYWPKQDGDHVKGFSKPVTLRTEGSPNPSPSPSGSPAPSPAPSPSGSPDPSPAPSPSGSPAPSPSGAPPPATSTCAAPYAPGEKGTGKPTLLVTSAATEAAPVTQDLKIGQSVADFAPVAPTEDVFNIQVDGPATADVGLYVRITFSTRRDYDLHLQYAAGGDGAAATSFNTTHPASGGPVFNAGHGGVGTDTTETVVGIRTKDCAGWTVVAQGYFTEGGAVKATAWLGEIVNDPEPPDGAAPAPAPAPSGPPADAPKGGGKGRVVEFVYTCPCSGHLQFGNQIPALPNFGGGVFPLEPGEIYLSAVVADPGGAVPVSIQQANATGGNMAVPGGRFCGKTAEPILLTAGSEVRIWVGNFHGASSAPPGVAPCPALARGGTITFTLSSTP